MRETASLRSGWRGFACRGHRGRRRDLGRREMTQPTEAEPSARPAPRGGRRKLIAIGIAVVVVLVAVAVAVFYYFNQPASCIAAANTTPNTIKLGFTISLTGSFNVEGTNLLRGIQTATQMINDHLRHQAEVTAH